MTPKEMRAMTARMNSAHVPACALREDLKVALTELSELQDAYNEVTAALRERAERAEARVDEVTGLVAELTIALVRVRALCDNARGRHTEGCCGYLGENEVRAALDGP